MNGEGEPSPIYTEQSHSSNGAHVDKDYSAESTFFDPNNVQEVVTDWIKKNPTIAVAGGFVLGFLIGFWMKD